MVGDNNVSPSPKTTIAAAKSTAPSCGPDPAAASVVNHAAAMKAAESTTPRVRRRPAIRRSTTNCATTTVTVLAANAMLSPHALSPPTPVAKAGNAAWYCA
jgi:hypothetical protein